MNITQMNAMTGNGNGVNLKNGEITSCELILGGFRPFKPLCADCGRCQSRELLGEREHRIQLLRLLHWFTLLMH